MGESGCERPWQRSARLDVVAGAYTAPAEVQDLRRMRDRVRQGAWALGADGPADWSVRCLGKDRDDPRFGIRSLWRGVNRNPVVLREEADASIGVGPITRLEGAHARLRALVLALAGGTRVGQRISGASALSSSRSAAFNATYVLGGKPFTAQLHTAVRPTPMRSASLTRPPRASMTSWGVTNFFMPRMICHSK